MINELVAMHCYPSDHVLQLLTYCLKPPCLVFTYMENGSLDDKLHNDPWNPPLSWAYRAKIALGTAKALCHLHGNNIVHGDIKSSSILLDKYFEPKIERQCAQSHTCGHTHIQPVVCVCCVV